MLLSVAVQCIVWPGLALLVIGVRFRSAEALNLLALRSLNLLTCHRMLFVGLSTRENA